MILSRPKSRCCTPRKKLIKFAIIFEDSFLVTNINEEEEQDVISWATFIWNVSSDFRL